MRLNPWDHSNYFKRFIFSYTFFSYITFLIFLLKCEIPKVLTDFNFSYPNLRKYPFCVSKTSNIAVGKPILSIFQPSTFTENEISFTNAFNMLKPIFLCQIHFMSQKPSAILTVCESECLCNRWFSKMVFREKVECRLQI